MKATDIQNEDDIFTFIEGTLNDFEGGISSKKEAIENMVELVIHCVKLKSLPK